MHYNHLYLMISVESFATDVQIFVCNYIEMNYFLLYYLFCWNIFLSEARIISSLTYNIFVIS